MIFLRPYRKILGIVHQIGPLSLTSTSFTIHYPLIIPSFGATYREGVTKSIIKQIIHNTCRYIYIIVNTAGLYSTFGRSIHLLCQSYITKEACYASPASRSVSSTKRPSFLRDGSSNAVHYVSEATRGSRLPEMSSPACSLFSMDPAKHR